MPHLTVEYSRNLSKYLDVVGLVRELHEAALETEVFRISALRTRGVRRDEAVIADGHPDRAFVDVVLRIGTGRDEATKTFVCDHVFAALDSAVEQAHVPLPVALSFELQTIDPDHSRRKNPLHTLLDTPKES